MHGGRAQKVTLAALGEIDPAFAAARAEYAGKVHRLRNVDELLADLWATRDVCLQKRVELRVDEHGVAQPAVLPVLNVIGATLERVSRIEQRARNPQHIHVSLMRHLVGNVVNLLAYYLPPEVLPEALDRLRALQAVLPMPEVRSVPCQPAPDERPTDSLPESDAAGAEDTQSPVYRSPLDTPATDDWGQTRSGDEQVVEALPEPSAPDMAEDSGLRCGTCANMQPNGWCRSRRFFVTPAVLACDVYYEPVPADRSGQ